MVTLLKDLLLLLIFSQGFLLINTNSVKIAKVLMVFLQQVNIFKNIINMNLCINNVIYNKACNTVITTK